MGRRRNLVTSVLGILNLAAWGGLIYLGVSDTKVISAQHSPGYPTPGEILLFVDIPIAAFTIAGAATAVCIWRPQNRLYLWSVLGLCLLAAPACLCGYGGGV